VRLCYTDVTLHFHFFKNKYNNELKDDNFLQLVEHAPT
jgi:hypothetical protein